MKRSRENEVAVALSAGGAAAMAQVGVMEELEAAGVSFGGVAGASAGALVGAAVAAGDLARLRDSMATLSRRRVFSLLDPCWPRSGLIGGKRCLGFLEECLVGRIEELPIPYAAVATDIRTGDEVVLRDGSLVDAIRASIAVPGIFSPQRREGRYLVDGGLTNPLPVSVARTLGPPFVIAISVIDAVRGSADPGEPHEEPVLLDVLNSATRVMSGRLADARWRDHPADYLIRVDVPKLGLFDFHRSAEMIAAGREAARREIPALLRTLAMHPLQRRFAQWIERSGFARWGEAA